jgi:hypothetical protein
MKKFLRFLFTSLFPGVFLIVAGLCASVLIQSVFGMISFLCFFVIGITLIIEGFKQMRHGQ